MPILTFLARFTDGLLLVASTEHAQNSHTDLDSYKKQAKFVLKKLNQHSPTRCSVETGPYLFHYSIADGICILTLTERNYPRQLAFSYLEDIHNLFMVELRKEHGNNWNSVIATVARPYVFIKFDRHIQKKRKEYLDPKSNRNLQKLSGELHDIHNIMKKNITDVLNRGTKLESVSNRSRDMLDKSKQFKWGAKKLNAMEALRKYAPVIGGGTLLLLVFYYKFLW